jgi:hypothetical protein
VSSYKLPEQRTFAHDLCTKVVSFLTASLYAETSNYAPIRLRSQPSLATPSSGLKSVSWANVAKTWKNLGASLKGAKTPSSSISRRAPTTISGATMLSHSNPPKQDKRLLVTVEPGALLQRLEPFALRQELSARITGLTLASILTIAPTRTGWAITLADLTIRDLLMNEENAKTILSIFKALAIKQPKVWYNYAVLGVPSTIHQLIGGTLTNTAELVSEEV